MLSSRRIALLGSLLALAALAVPSALAAGKAPDCAAGAEKAGCKLPVRATYSVKTKTGSAEGTVSAAVITSGISVTVLDTYIDCTKFDPSNGDEAGIQASYKGTQRPKVGKTYTIRTSESENSEEGGSSTADAELTLNYKSAKLLVLTLHEVFTAEGKLMCDGGKTWTLKRQ